MKTLLICSVLFLSGIALSAEPTNEDLLRPGRFQIVVGRLDNFGIADVNKVTLKEVTQNTVFKIDTSTGQTWYAERTVKPAPSPNPKDRYVPTISWVLIDR